MYSGLLKSGCLVLATACIAFMSTGCHKAPPITLTAVASPPTGVASITCTVTDDKSQTANANTSITILAPYVAPIPHVQQLGTISEFLRVMHEERQFSDLFSSFLLENSLRTQSDLVDQLFNPAEKRLARLLLLMTELVPSEGDSTLIPPVSQEAPASMIGSTRPRINLFMNRFRKLGYIDYEGRIMVHKSMLHVFLSD